jgi:hypothetical protein
VFIFEIPVYRVPQDQFAKETDPMNSAKAILAKVSRDQQLDSGELFWLHHLDELGIWRYNQMIGCIRLQISKSRVRACIYRRKGKRFTRSMRGLFECADERDIYYTNPRSKKEDIFSKLLHELRNLKNHPVLRGRHVDIECFENLGPFVDWERLFKSV